MKKLLLLIMSLVLISACAPEESEPTDTAVTPAVSEAPDASESEAPVESEEPSDDSAIADGDWEAIYKQYFADNYPAQISSYFMGVSVEDFDFDGVPELYILDNGASASAFAYFFDIDDDGNVVMVAEDNSYTGAPNDSYLHINSAEDFELYELENGDFKFFCISRNGDLSFAFRDTISFETGENGVMKLMSNAFASETFDPDSGEIVSGTYTVMGESASAEKYDTAVMELTSNAIKHEYTGTLVREYSDSEASSSDRLIDMISASFELYNANNE